MTTLATIREHTSAFVKKKWTFGLDIKKPDAGHCILLEPDLVLINLVLFRQIWMLTLWSSDDQTWNVPPDDQIGTVPSDDSIWMLIWPDLNCIIRWSDLNCTIRWSDLNGDIKCKIEALWQFRTPETNTSPSGPSPTWSHRLEIVFHQWWWWRWWWLITP